MGTKVRERESVWVFTTPVSNVRLGEAVNYEFEIESVTLVDGDHLPYRRLRLGFPERISDLRERHGGIYERFFTESDTYAVLRPYGRPDEIWRDLLQQVRDALAILAVSQLGFARRRTSANPVLAEEEPVGQQNFLFVDDSDAAINGQWRTFGALRPFDLDIGWLRFHRQVFFLDLLDVIHGETSAGEGWRKDLRNAAILAGQSQMSLHLPQAFLWNMMVVELLLTRKGGEKGKFSDTLPRRAEAFLGWSGNWEAEDFEESIRDAWSKRCDFVHHGKREHITLEDLFFTDDLVLNLFTNIVRNIDRFDSKEAVVQFSKKVEAERLLGVEPSVRPKSLTFYRRRYTDKDFEKTSFRR